MAALPTGTVTFLFTDIEGSTTLLQRLGDRRYAEVLEEHRCLLRAAFAEGNGQEIATHGDAFLVAFSRARDAVGTGVAAQLALAKHAWPDDTSLRVRMGLHTGEPVSGSGDYVGLDVHRAARICAAGHGGQILLSQAVRVLASSDLPPRASLRDLGTHRLKDLREPEYLFQVVHPNLPSDFPPLKSLDIQPNNLPIQLTSFIGREREKAEVGRLLMTSHLVTLTGSGGAGKTRLALQVAAETLEEFPGGVWLVELAALSDPTLVPQAVASALAVSEQPGRALTDTLRDALRGKSMLVVLDNCEHLVTACARLADALLRTCPNLRILTTSREALGVTGETIWRVPSLSVPDPQRLPPFDRFSDYEAVRLFIDRAVASAPQFGVTSGNAPAIAQVCHRLDGIPLAIELAAARVKVLAVEQIAARLDDRFRLLTSGSRTALPRQQTLRAAMDWSYDLLSEQERTVLRRLSVFAGGWTLEAAEAICSGGRVNADDTIDLLTSLVDKSLVLTDVRRDAARYRLLESVRHYSRDRLLDSGEATDIQRRHRDWFLALAERGEPELRGPGQVAWLARFETEHDNLRAALDFSETEESGVDAQLRLAGALQWFWYMHGHWSEGRTWLEAALARSSNTPSPASAKALRGAGFLAWRQGDNERATALSEKGLALCRELGDKRYGAWFLMHLGDVALNQGDHPRATRLLRDALIMSRESGDQWFIALAIAHLGEMAHRDGNYAQAVSYYRESLALFRETKDKAYTALFLRHLGEVELHQGDHEEAAACYTEGLTLAREVKARREAEECIAGLAQLACAKGKYQDAARLFGSAEALRAILAHRRESYEQARHDQSLASACAALGEAAFATAWAEGRAMTLEQAIESALTDRPG